MKKFFLTVFISLSLWQAQAQVIIKPETARWFLEAADERDELREKDSLRVIQVDSLTKTVDTKNAIITTYVAEELVYAAEYNALFDEVEKQDETIVNLENKVAQRGLLNAVLAGAAGGAVIGATIGQPVIGAIVGAGVGLVANIIKRRRD